LGPEVKKISKQLKAMKPRSPHNTVYENFESLIEVACQFKLPTGQTRLLRALIDTGATDNFINSKTVKELNLPTQPLPRKIKVELGSASDCAYVKSETTPLHMSFGQSGSHKSTYSVLNLGEYDVILGRPFQRSMATRIEGDDIFLPSRRGYQPLPRWASAKKQKLAIVQTSFREMHSIMKCSQEKFLLTFSKSGEGDSEDQPEEGKVEEPPLKPEEVKSLIHKVIAKIERSSKMKAPHKNPSIQRKIEKQTLSPSDDRIPHLKGIPELESLLNEYIDVFPVDLPIEPPPEREFSMKIHLKEGHVPPAQAPYRASSDAQEAIQKTLEYLYAHGFARDSVSEYAAPVTLAKKADGTWRFCVDYRKLNSITKEAKYPLPRIDDCLDKLGKAKFFSKLDLRSGYWQVRIHEKDIEKTAFRTTNGHHEWLVMPFGLQGAPSCFQRMMNHYLRHHLGKFLIVYLDDILVFSETKEEHLQHLRILLEILREKKLYAKGSKCDLFKTSVIFLGFVVQGGQITTDPSKIKAVKNWPLPTTVREVRSFLGLCNFYRKFIQNHATIAKPLTNVLKSTEFKDKYGIAFHKKAPVTLNEDERKAFEALKSALISAPCLAIYDPDMPTEVWTDASWENSTTGAVLLQNHGQGLQPVAFISKVMNSAESRYPVFEQELLALKNALEEWRHYLLPIHFKAKTDHNGLRFLRTQKHLSERQWRWLGLISEFTFDLEYRPGQNMTVPDSLSRRTMTEADVEDMLRLSPHEDTSFELQIPLDNGKQKVLLTRRRVVKHQDDIPEVFDYTDDPTYGVVHQRLVDEEANLPPSYDLYSVNDKGNLVWCDKHQTQRICVPQRYRAVIIQEHHDTPIGAHFGANKTYARIRQRYMWPHMIPELPSLPWEYVSMDFCGPFPKTKSGKDNVLVVVDNLTRLSVFIPCTTEVTAKETAELFLMHVWKLHGLPRRINSDRGPQFISHFWKELWKSLATKVALSAPYHPESNSIVERQNDTFQQSLRSFVNARQNDWDSKLIFYEFAYNSSVHPSTGETPFFLNYGRHPLVPTAIVHPTNSPAAEDFVQQMTVLIGEAGDHIRLHQAQAADRRESDFQKHDFQVGDKVLLNTTNYNLQLPSRKLAPKWIGPLEIKQIRGPNTVLIDVPPRLHRLEPLQNVQYLKRYISRHPDVGPPVVHQDSVEIEGTEEFEVEDILAHRGTGNKIQYLVRFKSYGPEDDLWLPLKNLVNAPEILQHYHARQDDKEYTPRSQSKAKKQGRVGHVFTALRA
jgi:hypothetical protein